MCFKKPLRIWSIATLMMVLAACEDESATNPVTPAPAQPNVPSELTPEPEGLPEGWREVREGVDGYPAGPMLEIALRRTHADRLEMFRWRSEFISMLSAQPGTLVEREWHSLSGIPENTEVGTWTGMTWWENQQRWQDMANMLFPSPVTSNWLQTIHMTLIFVKPTDSGFDLRTLSQSGQEVLELGLLAFPGPNSNDTEPAEAMAYLDALTNQDVDIYRFEVYPNLQGFIGPYMTAYNENGPPDEDERWFVYMASYGSNERRDAIHANNDVQETFEALKAAAILDHSDFQVMTRSTSKVCCQNTGMCSLDPDTCEVGVLGGGDTWASNCSQCPRPCIMGYDVCSQLSTETCLAVGGSVVDTCP